MNGEYEHDGQGYRTMVIAFAVALAATGLFNAVMWYGFTCSLFGPEVGDMKRMGYLAGYEDCRSKLKQAEAPGGTVLSLVEAEKAEQIQAVFIGDSFCNSLARAYSIRNGNAPVLPLPMWWDQKNGLSQINRYLDKKWLHQHKVEEVIVERAEYEWLNTFANPGSTEGTTTIEELLSHPVKPAYQRREPLDLFNNGNFKVVTYNLGYLFSPTAFNQSDVVKVQMTRRLFNCSYGNKLLFFKGDLRGALTPGRRHDYDASLKNLHALAERCRDMGLRFYMVIPPSKGFLYRPWVERPFYNDSPLLEELSKSATADGYVDLKEIFRGEIGGGILDLYFPDDAHWTFPSALKAAEAIIKARTARPL
jgi:hypothetical protein